MYDIVDIGLVGDMNVLLDWVVNNLGCFIYF